jgi:hypothetical protein
MRTELLRFNGAVERDLAIDSWMKEHSGELGAIAHQWFEVVRKCGDEVRELLHDCKPIQSGERKAKTNCFCGQNCGHSIGEGLFRGFEGFPVGVTLVF